jgi:predicted RNA binding protein YcfA (HicA-like mRNA interferase family)
MSRLPARSSRRIIQVLRKVGFVEAPKRGKGSPVAFVRHDPFGTRLVIVPYGHDIPRGTVLAILEQAGLSRDEFLKLL